MEIGMEIGNHRAEESTLRALERSEAFSWTPTGDVSSLGAHLLASGFVGEYDGVEGWIFDHVPKTGGSEFAALAERRLDAHDHLYIRWPATWHGVLVGRLRRVAVVHGHGARYAETLAPERRWRVAVCVREPLERTVSAYQQALFHSPDGTAPPSSLTTWLEGRLATFGETLALNDQVRWLATDPPQVDFPCAPGKGADPDDLIKAAFERLDRCDLVGTPDTVSNVFAAVARLANLRIRDERSDSPPANMSPRPSREIVAELPDDLIERLRGLTALDQALFDRAATHPGRVF